MPEEQGTLTESGDTSQPEPFQSGDLISTVDMAIPIPKETPSEETQKTEETDESDKGAEDAKTEETKAEEQKAADLKAAEDAKAEESRFDKHPRFQELITSNRAFKAQLAQQAEQIEALKATPEKKEPEYNDLGMKSNEELTEMFEENPRTFLQDFAKQIHAEVRSEVLSEVQGEIAASREAEERKSIEATFNNYAQDNPTFDDMWDSGKIQNFMDKNPGHNAISAHMALTKETDTQAAIDEAVAKALKDAETKSDKSQKAKKNAQVLGSGPASSGHAVGQIPVELKDTKKYGGLATVLASRSLARTKQASL